MYLQHSQSYLLSRLIDFSVLVLFISLFTFERPSTVIVWRISLYLFLGLQMLYILVSGKIKMNFYVSWIFTLLFYCLFSYFWSTDPQNSIQSIYNLLTNFILIYMLLQYCVNEEKLELILKFIVISSMILAITVLFNDFDSIINGERLGMGLEEFNSNDIGLKLSLSSIIVLYLLLKFKNKIYLFPYVLLLSVTLLTGSKKSLLVLILGNLIFFLLGSGKYKIRNLILLFIMLSSIFYLIFNNETLYDILGSRLEDMLSAFSGGKIESTHTDMVRINMTETGFQFFSEKPVFGYGLDSFKILYGNATGMFTYSHNNYIELAVNLGLVGFILYYCMYFFILIKGFKLYKNNPKDKLILLSLVIVSILMVIEVGLVSYIDKFYLILILLSYFSITFKKNNEESNHV